MPLHRREFLNLAAVGAAAALTVSARQGFAATKSKIKAIAFDGFPIIDPRPVFAKVEEFLPGKGMELSNAWRIRQFEYTWLRTLTGQYADFWKVTEDALTFALKTLKLELASDKRDQLMQTYLELKVWPDVPAAITALKESGMRMAFLSNFTAKMLEAPLKNSGLSGVFEEHLSTDKVKAYKPDPRAYQMGLDAFRLKREEIAFAAFAGWDVYGAKTFGYPTFWVNRMNAPLEELGATPDGMGANLGDLANFVKTWA